MHKLVIKVLHLGDMQFEEPVRKLVLLSGIRSNSSTGKIVGRINKVLAAPATVAGTCGIPWMA